MFTIANKEHTCCECGQIIRIGSSYERDSAIFEGEFTVYKTCIPCRDVRRSTMECGFYYGGLWAEIHEAYCQPELDEDGEEDNSFCICPF